MLDITDICILIPTTYKGDVTVEKSALMIKWFLVNAVSHLYLYSFKSSLNLMSPSIGYGLAPLVPLCIACLALLAASIACIWSYADCYEAYEDVDDILFIL